MSTTSSASPAATNAAAEFQRYFLSEAVRHARTLTCEECVEFLEGMAASVGCEKTRAKLRSVIGFYATASAQLDRLANGLSTADPND